MTLSWLQQHVDVTLLMVGHLDDEQTREGVRIIELPAPRPIASRSLIRRRLHDLWRVLVRRRPAETVDTSRVQKVLRRALRRMADDFDVVVVQHFYLASLVRARRRARWLLEVQNVPSQRALQELVGAPGRRQRWLLAREAENARRDERRAVAAFDTVVFVSEEDRAAVCGSRSGRSTIVVPNGVDMHSMAPTDLPSEPTILLPASLSYRPNVLGAIWFCDEVLPLVNRQVPGVRFMLVGRRPVPEVVALAQRPGVELHADVPDMAPWLQSARVVVVPLQIGTGTRLKALEAMASRRPVVGTTIGLEGLGIVDRIHARIVDDPKPMADAIVDIVTNDAVANALADAGRLHVDANFRWERLAERYADMLTMLAGRRP
jgi:glycosyltransferase involved in cell wall biosynthesis